MKWSRRCQAVILAFMTVGTVLFSPYGETAQAAETDLINENPQTFCNPVNLSYSLQYGLRGNGGFRMLADPQPVYYQGEYWLFPTHATGYYHSRHLVNWEFVYSRAEQINNYAPGVFVHDGYLYISRHSSGNLYRTDNPLDGNSWRRVRGAGGSIQDPYYFKDPDTGRIFLLHGCVGINDSNTPPIRILELNTDSPNLDPLPVDTSVPGASEGAGYAVFTMRRDLHGYEVPGQYNDDYSKGAKSWLEGAGMIKHNGKYYVYYSGPATECAAYTDGCYVAEDPLGPYRWCSSSPFTYKVTGYTRGSAHGHDIVEQTTGTVWKFGSVSLASNDSWERRISLYPVNFDKYDRPVTDLSVADYPMWIPGSKNASFEHQGPDWNLLSYGMEMDVSSTLEKTVTGASGNQFVIRPECAADENIRTWWSAETGEPGEWLAGDLGKVCTVHALQLNFIEQDAAGKDFLQTSGLSDVREYTGCYRYLIEYSLDGNKWFTLVDKSEAEAQAFQGQDTTHDYYELKEGTDMRYVRVTNMGEVPAGGKFAVSGLRIFGNGNGQPPQEVSDFAVSRVDGADERSAEISWQPVEGAEGYIIRYGTHADSMNLHHQVIGESSARIHSLTTYQDYYFRIDAYNDSGRTIGTQVKKLVGNYSKAKAFAGCRVTFRPEEYFCDGTEKTPKAVVEDGDTLLKENLDYTITYENNVNAGTAKAILAGTGEYGGSVELEFTIQEAPVQMKAISDCQITLEPQVYTYDGTAKMPTVTVKDGDVLLTAGVDYAVSYENHIHAGTAKAVLSGRGIYTGTATKTFLIHKAPQTISYTKSYHKACGCKPFALKAKADNSGQSLTYTSSDHKVAVVRNGKVTIKGPGVATITVKATETADYEEETVRVIVKADPARQSIVSLKPAKGKKLSIKWKKDVRVSGYEIQCCPKKDFKKAVRTVKISKGKTNSKTISKLSRGKRYYVKVRSFQKVNVEGKAQKLYGAWSKVKRSGKIR